MFEFSMKPTTFYCKFTTFKDIICPNCPNHLFECYIYYDLCMAYCSKCGLYGIRKRMENDTYFDYIGFMFIYWYMFRDIDLI